jgi:hypothetical protein
VRGLICEALARRDEAWQCCYDDVTRDLGLRFRGAEKLAGGLEGKA